MAEQEIKTAVADALARMCVKFAIGGGYQTKRTDLACFAWRAEFTRPGKKDALGADYFTGIGNVTQPKSKAMRAYHTARPVTPTAADVLYSLLLDSSAGGQSFSDWCADMGSSDDSIAAFHTYQACCEISKKLHAFFSLAEREELSKLLEDF